MTKIVMYGDQSAAVQVTVAAWKSLSGRVFVQEHAARYDSCTHRPCHTCGKPSEKQYTVCQECRDVLDMKRWEARPLAEWNGLPVWSESLSEWFDSPEDAADHEHCEPLMLVDSFETPVRELTTEYFCDDLPDDGDVPEWLTKAIEAFNASVEGKVLSYSIGPNRLAEPSDAST